MKLKELMEKYGEYDVVVSRSITTNEIMINGRKPKPKTVWDLRKGDKCYYISLFGDVEDTGGYLSPLSEAIDMGVVFLTEEEANKDLERRKVETLLLKHGGRRWFKNGKENWFVTFDRSVGFFRYVYTIRDQRQGTIYFDTEKQARKAVAEIGEERIKKALFEVR